MMEDNEKLFFNRMVELKKEDISKYQKVEDAVIKYFFAKSKGNYYALNQTELSFDDGKDAREFSRRYSELRKVLIGDRVTTEFPLPPNHSPDFDKIIGDYVEYLFKQNK